MSGNGKFDGDRVLTKMMAKKGIVPTGDGTFIEVSPEAGEKIAEEIEGGASFADNDTDGFTP